MIRVTVLASGQSKLFETMELAESWWMPRYGRSSIRIEHNVHVSELSKRSGK